MTTHLAVAIVADAPDQALELARSLPEGVSLVEYRLDMMTSPDVALLAEKTPTPAIFTCRPVAQGGHFTGSEAERRDILRQALASGYLVDIEIDTLPSLAPAIGEPQKIIGSWHDFDGMPHDWARREKDIRTLGAGIAKLVGMARTSSDVLPPMAWLAQTQQPAIGIAMGKAGILTRLLAPRFLNAFLTFASLSAASAPGQIHVRDMIELFGFQNIATADPLLVMFTPDPVPWQQVQHYRHAMDRYFTRGTPWLLPVPIADIDGVSPEMIKVLQMAGVYGAFTLPELNNSDLFADTVITYRLISDTRSEVSHLDPNPDAVMAFLISE
jgi:3-dehydroquinate dehydratase type I